jgi:putative transcriptional regulator
MRAPEIGDFIELRARPWLVEAVESFGECSALRGLVGGGLLLVVTNKGNHWFFVYGFQKNERSNNDEDETLNKLKAHLLSLTARAVGKAKQAGELIEVHKMRKTNSPGLATEHEKVKGLHNGGVMDQVTLRDFDRLCMPPVEPLEPEQIKKIREASHVSQAVFARLLNTSVSTVQKWEIGQKKPTGTALKLLHLVQKRGIDVAA